MAARGLVIGLCCSAGLIAVIAGGKEQDKPAADDAALSNVFPPKPDEATREAYIADLNAINPEIVGDRADLVVDRGRNQCSSIKDHPDDRERLVRETNMRFTTPDHPRGSARRSRSRSSTLSGTGSARPGADSGQTIPIGQPNAAPLPFRRLQPGRPSHPPHLLSVQPGRRGDRVHPTTSLERGHDRGVQLLPSRTHTVLGVADCLLCRLDLILGGLQRTAGGIHSVEAHGLMLSGRPPCRVNDLTGCHPSVTGGHISITIVAYKRPRPALATPVAPGPRSLARRDLMDRIRAAVHRTDPTRIVIVPEGARVTTIDFGQARALHRQLGEILARQTDGSNQ